MKITAHQALMYQFGYADFGNDLDIYPLEMRLVDWDRALEIEVEDDPCRPLEENWQLLLSVGFVSDRVLELVDPAIIPIISRVMELPILPLESCSGHGDDTEGYISVAFRDKGFGHKFLEACSEKFGENSPHFEIAPHRAQIIREFQIYLPIEFCLENQLPITMYWPAKTMSELMGHWTALSEVLNKFDGKGVYTPQREDFQKSVPVKDPAKMFRDVLKKLFKYNYPRD